MFRRRSRAEVEVPEGCRGIARQMRSQHPTKEGYSIVEVGFACAGLESVQDLHPLIVSQALRGRHRRITEQFQAHEAAVAVAATCAACPLGPAARLREDAELRRLAVTELGDKIRLQELVNEELRLRIPLGEAATAAELRPPEPTQEA